MKHCIPVHRVLAMLLACVMLNDVHANTASVPDRPVMHVLDQANWLSLDEKEKVAAELMAVFSEHDVDIYFVTLKKLPPQGAETYARTLGRSWSHSAVWCLIFQVPGDPAGFHVEAEGAEIDHEYIEQAIKEASRRARRENSEKERALTAIKECAENLRFLHASGQRGVEKKIATKKENQNLAQRMSRRKKLMIAAAGLCVIVGLPVLVFIVMAVQKRRAVYEFPDTTWRTRFQAPHSGGSGIVVNYRSKRLKQQ